MKTGEMTILAGRVDKVAANRRSQQCFCGRFKWSGFDFCRHCTSLLPGELRRPLIGIEVNTTVFCDAYDACRQYLSEQGIRPIEETGKL